MRVDNRNDINIGALVVIGVVSSLLILEIVVGLQAYFYKIEQQEYVEKTVNQPFWKLSDLTSRQQAELLGYRWVDREKGIVSIPIDRAMELVVQRQGRLPTTSQPAP
jgi:hypothetical protein